MKKIKYLLFVAILICLTGCGLFKQEQNNEIKEPTIIDKTEFETAALGNIKFKVPKSWYFEKKNSFNYYYPNEDDTNVFLMYGYNELDDDYKNPTEKDFETFLDAYVSGFVGNDNISMDRINNKQTKSEGDFFIGDVSLKAELLDEYREFFIHVVYDKKTAVAYSFSFTSIENISDDNKVLFNYIVDSVEIR